MKRFLTVSILVFLAVFIGNVYAPDEQKFKVYVDVDVNTSEKNKITENSIKSFIKRELRSINDVVVVKQPEDFDGIVDDFNTYPTQGIRITAIELKGGYIFISAVMIQIIDPYVDILKPYLSEDKYHEVLAEKVLSPLTGDRVLNDIPFYHNNVVVFDKTTNLQIRVKA